MVIEGGGKPVDREAPQGICTQTGRAGKTVQREEKCITTKTGRNQLAVVNFGGLRREKAEAGSEI